MKRKPDLGVFTHLFLRRLKMEVKTVILIIVLYVSNVFAIPAYSNELNFALEPDSQQISVSGTVTDASTGEPMPGVNILIKGTTMGVLTDASGQYTINVPDPNATLSFSFIGYNTQEILVAGQRMINVKMDQSVSTLDEVVVIGYGTTIERRDLTGAVGSVQGTLVSERKSTQISQALQGAISGVMITRNSSAPDATASIRIRGITTIGDSNPLVIVDGVPVDNINYVNSNDVESISVLKDAASASIYGSRAAAGVILVTTKRAKLGQRSLTYNFEYGIEKPTELPKNVGIIRYLEMANEQRWNDNGNDANQYPTFTKDYIDNYISQNAQNPDLYPITDWVDLIIKKSAPRESHMLSFTTGTKTVSTNASLSYDNIGALYDFKNYKRITARLNNDIRINDFLTAVIDLNLRSSASNNPSVDPIDLTRRMPPQYAAEWSDGRVAGGKLGDNIYGRLKYGGFSNNWQNQLGGKIAIDFAPLKGLKLSAIVSPNINFYKGKTFTKQIPYYSWDDPTLLEGYLDGHRITTLDETRNDSYSVTTQFLANYLKSFGKHDFNLMLGNENYYAHYENLGAARDEFELTSFPFLNLGSLELRDNSGSAYENAYRSFFGRLIYNYANKYLFQTNLRFDGSSRFHPDYRWGLFPSFSAGWVISEEKFMQNVSPVISFLKLRGSWGSLGNERIGNYPYQATIAFSNALLYEGNNVISVQTAAQTQYAIQDISWETTESFDIGVDINFLNDKLTFKGDYYLKTTKDMLLALEIPNYIGFDNPDQNTGKMKTKGWEADLGWNDNVGNLNYSLSFNISDFKSIMGDLGGTEFIGDQIKKEGSEFNEWYGYRSEGLFQDLDEVATSPKTSSSVRPGDVKYSDISGPNGVPDGIISPEYDRILLGGSMPRYMYGMNAKLYYKGFDLSIVLQGVGKRNARFETRMVRPLETQNTAVPEIIDGNYWSMYNTAEQNLAAKYPRLSEKVAASNNYVLSDHWLFDGSYLRFKNLTLSYNIPIDLIEKIKMQNVRIYTTITDLFSINKYPRGWDPEVAATSYPITTSFIFGISVKL